jgi:hypothetical protein
MRTLKWATYAKRPLRATELQQAISVTPESRDIDENDFIEVPRLISFCGGILAHDEESGVLRLVHYTTQKYLETHFSSMDGNAEIAMTCLRYFSFPVFSPPGGVVQGDLYGDFFPSAAELEKYTLMLYAARCWAEHVRGDTEEAFHALILETFQRQTTRDSVFAAATGGLILPRELPNFTTFLHLAALYNLPQLCLAILRRTKKDRA